MNEPTETSNNTRWTNEETATYVGPQLHEIMQLFEDDDTYASIKQGESY